MPSWECEINTNLKSVWRYLHGYFHKKHITENKWQLNRNGYSVLNIPRVNLNKIKIRIGYKYHLFLYMQIFEKYLKLVKWFVALNVIKLHLKLSYILMVNILLLACIKGLKICAGNVNIKKRHSTSLDGLEKS